MNWDRTCRRVLEVVGEDRGDLLHSLLLELGKHESGVDALQAALDDYTSRKGEDLARLHAIHQLSRIQAQTRGDCG